MSPFPRQTDLICTPQRRAAIVPPATAWPQPRTAAPQPLAEVSVPGRAICLRLVVIRGRGRRAACRQFVAGEGRRSAGNGSRNPWRRCPDWSPRCARTRRQSAAGHGPGPGTSRPSRSRAWPGRRCCRGAGWCWPWAGSTGLSNGPGPRRPATLSKPVRAASSRSRPVNSAGTPGSSRGTTAAFRFPSAEEARGLAAASAGSAARIFWCRS